MKFNSLFSYSFYAFIAQKSSIRRISTGQKSAKVPWDFGPIDHLSLSKHVWSTLIKPGDTVVDATSGNGRDGLHLASLVFSDDDKANGRLYCLDIQDIAIQSTRKAFQESGKYNERLENEQIKLVCASHVTFPSELGPESVTAIVYNLGYLPGDPNFKSRPAVEIKELDNPKYDTSARIQTQSSSTLKSIEAALPLIKQGGLISITAYPLHKGGAEETSQVQAMLAGLDVNTWRVYCHQSLNKPLSPILFSAFKIDKTGKSRV